MKKNLKLLSGILMASFITAPIVDSNEIVKARVSRQVVVNASSGEETSSSPKLSSTKNSNSSSTEKQNSDKNSQSSKEDQNPENENTTTSTSKNDSTGKENIEVEEGSGTTSIFDMLNSDKNITVKELTDLSTPLSHSSEFKEEFNTTFPKLDPLRQLSSTNNDLNLYLDVNSNETKTITQYLKDSESVPSIYADQNKCDILISEISRLLTQINEEISEELPSTIFSLMPTVTVFNDTFRILSLEYDSVLQNNFEKQIVLKMLLKNVEENLVSLLSSINEFKIQLPDLIDELDKLAELVSSSKNNSTNNSSTSSNDKLTDDDQDQEDLDDEEIIVDDENVDKDEDTEEVIVDNNEDTEEKPEENTSESQDQIDPNSMLYFGDQGQEIIYDESTQKFYQLDPDNPDSEDLVEYLGEVTKMTLAEYLDTDVFFDKDGNELLYDADTNSYFSYDEESDEFVLYEGEVVKLKIRDLLESEE